MVCIYSDQKDSFCSNCFSLTRRTRWVTPIGKWSKPLCIKRLLLNRIITFWGMWIFISSNFIVNTWFIETKERQEIKAKKSKERIRKESLAHFIWVSNKLKPQWIEILWEWEQEWISPFVILTYQLLHEVSQMLAKSVLVLWKQQLGSHHPLYNFPLNLGEFDKKKKI